MMKIGVVGAGNFEVNPFIQRELSSCDYLIAVDGGLDHVLSLERIPDEVIGDFDSMSSEAKRWMEEEHILHTRFPAEKDKTDSALALIRAMEKGATEVLMLGFIGTRMDHSLSNIFLLDRLDKAGVEGKIADANNVILLVKEKLEIQREHFADFKYVSVLPLFVSVTIDMVGFKYEVHRLSMEFGANDGMGISNEIISEKAEIRLHDSKDRILVIFSKDGATKDVKMSYCK